MFLKALGIYNSGDLDRVSEISNLLNAVLCTHKKNIPNLRDLKYFLHAGLSNTSVLLLVFGKIFFFYLPIAITLLKME